MCTSQATGKESGAEDDHDGYGNDDDVDDDDVVSVDVLMMLHEICGLAP